MTGQRALPLNQSRLYKVGSRARLVAILNLDTLQALETLIELSDSNYRAYTGSDGRDIQYPIGPMAACHKRLARLLSRIEIPDYVHSKTGHSYVSNALAHANNTPIAKTDISKYFPSTTFAHIQRFFTEDLTCPPDVAWYLTKLCTFNGHIPTGSQISNPIAFLANRPMFDRIHEYALKHGCVMTLLQDDIVISGAAASKRMLNDIVMEIRRSGLRASPKRRKTKTYPASAIKVITGVIVKGKSATVPNRRRKMIANAHSRALKAETKKERAAAVLELRGRINEADQIDPSAVHPTHRRLVRN
jgi:RNA-directed DNA polymerase